MVSFNIANDVDGYTSFSEYGRPNKAYSSAEPIGRPRCLQRLADTISCDEKSAEYLFKAFDVDVIDNGDLYSNSPVATSSLLPPFADPPSFSLQPRDDERDVEHPYLSTPLRMNYFSKLSPTILRDLLRSPSLRVFSPDTSFSEECSGYLLDSALVASSHPFEPSKSSDPFTDTAKWRVLSYPISPPPTAKIPSAPHLPALSVCDEISTDDVEVSHTVESSISSYSKELALTLPSPPLEERRPLLHTRHTCPRLSASTIAQFRLVVDELGRTGNDPEKRSLLQSNLRPSLLPTACKFTHAQGSAGVAGNITPSTMQEPSRVHGVLEAEFVDLLLQRAEREEAEAEQLKALGMRLRMLAQRRRELARVVQK
ncbi:uncharacterized protein EV420DRAFT_1685574 [Desarmillaria tabescens]|uniref:Uncharacterized protein n=1 Tax=Armillaria tabescens TaxID=1929756 RepID=A0AA39U0G8_ARMTA|nr:uncharacterized protein EV420DRAFT_1685574 [Desarmillaria tabescens]KAK0468104.1 hypothetical protein EV420DRAFT_1685574 [Desarmillaria tabescens]